MSRLNSIADAVVTLLNENGGTNGGTNATLSQSFVAERVYVPVFDRVTNDEINVQVLGLEESAAIISRSETDRKYTIRVAIYQKILTTVNAEQKAELDALSDFRQEVSDLLFANKRMTTYPDAALIECNVIAPYDAGMIEKGTFVTVINATYKMLI